MRFIPALAACLLLAGCHSGPMGAASLSLTGTVLGIINQDWLAEQGRAVGLKINQTPAAQTVSGSTSPASE